MIPLWTNWYAILTMAAPSCSLLEVEELITLTPPGDGKRERPPGVAGAVP
jgi:hypothetical protein